MMGLVAKKSIVPGGVNEYIAKCPEPAAPKKRTDQEGRNLLIWLAVSFASWYVFIVGGGTIIGLWADITLVAVAIWIFRYVWQTRRPTKGWNASSVSAGLIAVFLCAMWLVVVGILYTALPKSAYFN